MSLTRKSQPETRLGLLIYGGFFYESLKINCDCPELHHQANTL